ncbi:MAG: prephenate dehydrogenase/arogenate dehydrogenase family protein, partial [Treponema sp.]|nr:prephenate dehydrogenase/arogenate dehydrogenase family protein [Treponema sp.]
AFAMALRPLVRKGRLLAFDIDAQTLALAERDGLIDEGFDGRQKPETMLSRCDLVFLCLNPSSLLRFLGAWEGAFRPGSLVTDVAGIKGSIAAAAEKFRADVDFIPGHPMAGSEKGGFINAGRCDFRGKNYILTPLKRNRRENLEFLKALIRRMGFRTITETSAEDHDRKAAFTSQLCHVIAAALIDCEADTAITRFGGGSFEDLTRIAMLNVPMWTELFIENSEKLLERIDLFEKSLDAIRELIARGAESELKARLGAVRDRRSAMNG